MEREIRALQSLAVRSDHWTPPIVKTVASEGVGFTINNEFHVPVDKVVRIELASRDVIHSFFVPDIQSRRDVVPGRNTNLWFEATTPGHYEIACSELCGFGHYSMRGEIIVHTAEDYAKWRAENLENKSASN